MTEQNIWFLILIIIAPMVMLLFPYLIKKHVFPYVLIIGISLEYLNPDFFGQILTIGKIIPITLFLFYIIGNRASLNLVTSRIFTPLFLFTLYFIISLSWSIAPTYGSQRGISLILLITSFWLAAHSSQTEVGLRHFIGAFVLLSIMISIFGFIGFVDRFTPDTLLRYRVFNLNPIVMSQMITYGTIPVIMCIILNQPSEWAWLNRKWFPFVVVLNLIGLIVSTSKTGILVFILVVIILLKAASNRARFQIFILAILVLISVRTVNKRYPIFENLYSRVEVLEETKLNQAYEDLFPDRSKIWREGIDLFFRYPTLGIGLTSYERMTTTAKVPHNDLIRTFCEGGIIGGILWISLMLISFLTTVRSVRITQSNQQFANFEWFGRTMFFIIVVHIAYSQSIDLIFSKFSWVILGMTNSLWGIFLTKSEMLQSTNYRGEIKL